MDSLLFKPVGVEGEIQVYATETWRIGLLTVGIDGYYEYTPDKCYGYAGWILRELSDKMEELNAAWDAEVKAYFENGVKSDEMP